MLAAWRSSLKSDARRNRSTFDIRDVPSAYHFWVDPALVENPKLNGQALNKFGYPVAPSPTILATAHEDPAAGFRLACLSELEAIFKAAHRARVEEAKYRSPHKRVRAL